MTFKIIMSLSPFFLLSLLSNIEITNGHIDSNGPIKEFYVLPKGPVPPEGQSNHLHRVLPHPSSNSNSDASNIKFFQIPRRVVNNLTSKGFHVLPKGPVSPEGQSNHLHSAPPHPSSNSNRDASNIKSFQVPRRVFNNHPSKGFHVLPKGPIPPEGQSNHSHHALPHPSSNSNSDASNIKFFQIPRRVVNNLTSKRFHVLPKGPIPPKGQSNHSHSAPPHPSSNSNSDASNIKSFQVPRRVFNNHPSKGFHVLPKGPIPPEGQSNHLHHVLPHPSSNSNSNASNIKFFQILRRVVNNLPSKGFHVLPKAPIPPKGGSNQMNPHPSSNSNSDISNIKIFQIPLK